MAGTNGFNKRVYRRLYIVTGSELVTATKQQAFLPAGASVTCYSGEALVRTRATGGAQSWEKPSATNVNAGTNPAIYFANADSDDFDVLASGKIPGIYAGDKFEVQSPFFDTSKTYNPGDKLVLVASANMGRTGYMLTNDLAEPSSGSTTYDVVGIVSKGVVEFNNGTAVTVATGTAVVTGGPAVWVNDTQSTKVLQFYTVAEKAVVTKAE